MEFEKFKIDTSGKLTRLPHFGSRRRKKPTLPEQYVFYEIDDLFNNLITNSNSAKDHIDILDKYRKIPRGTELVIGKDNLDKCILENASCGNLIYRLENLSWRNIPLIYLASKLYDSTYLYYSTNSWLYMICMGKRDDGVTLKRDDGYLARIREYYNGEIYKAEYPTEFVVIILNVLKYITHRTSQKTNRYYFYIKFDIPTPRKGVIYIP